MNDAKPTPDSTDDTAATTPAEDVTTDDSTLDDSTLDDSALEDSTPGDSPAAGPYGVGPFSVREVALGGVWLLAFIVSFFPIYGPIGSGVTVWGAGIDWVLTIGVPTAAVFLLALRRLSPDGIRRVGSLGIDQFASVAFSVSAVVWLSILWNSFVSLAGSRVFVATWVVWVEFFLMLAGVVLTVFAPILPTLRDDFRGRAEVVAHNVARPTRAVVRRPVRPARPVADRPETRAEDAVAPVYGNAPAYGSAPVEQPVDTAWPQTTEPADPTAVLFQEPQNEPTPEPQAPATQAFWALSPVERDVVDELGMPLFTVGPTAWALVIEDRGDTFVVRHEDGRVGYLHDTSGVTRG